MKKGLLIFLAILAVGAAGFCFMRSHQAEKNRAILLDTLPELGWVKNELKLSDAQFAKVSELHLAYRPRCLELCHRLAEARQKVDSLAQASRRISPELEAAVNDYAAVHATCRKAMLEHLYETARVLDPAQASRYLETMLPYVLDPANLQSGESKLR